MNTFYCCRSIANPIVVLLSLFIGAVLLRAGPLDTFGEALMPDAAAQSLRIAYSVLPRATISLAAGAALALSGTLYQQLLRNPLAEPTTLGVAAGSHLALVIASLFAPFLLDGGRLWVAAVGGFAVVVAVAFVVGRKQFEPVSMIIGGLLISLFCSGLTSALTVFNHEFLSDIYAWQSGNLRQMGWQHTKILVAILTGCGIIVWCMRRTLAIVALGDEMMKAVGMNVSLLRGVILLIATLLGCAVVSSVGVIAFLGFLAPALARLCGARTTASLLLWAPLQGAALLFLADSVTQNLLSVGDVPTGTALAIIGAPFLMLLLWRRSDASGRSAQLHVPAGNVARWQLLAASWVAMLFVFLLVILVGRTDRGWHLFQDAMHSDIFWQMRIPRTFVALAAGSVLAMSGTLLQRATGNNMASPEILGITSAGALSVLCVLFLLPSLPLNVAMCATTVGAFLAASAIMVMCLYGMDPLRLILGGMALTIVCSGLMTLFLSSGDPRMSLVINWLSGSTYNATTGAATFGLAATMVLLTLAVGLTRLITILPLGDATTKAIGMSPNRSRMIVFFLATMGTACGTILIGPLTFVGLIAPHLARQLGCRKPGQELLVATALGGTTLMLADWIGRNIIYPWQLPAGIVAAVISGPFVILLLRKVAQ